MRIAVVSANGGSGRTTLILNLALGLCQRGLRTLMVDLDPQGSLGFLLARKDDEWRGLADYLMGRVTLQKAVKRSNMPLLSLLPRGRLDPADAGEFERAVGQPKILSGGLRNLELAFDVLLLDTPPGTGMVPSGALAVADEVLVTIRADALAVRSAIRSLRLVDLARRKANSHLRLTGVLPTFTSRQRDFEQSLIREMKRKGIPVLDQAIPESEYFRRASDLGQPVARLSGVPGNILAPIGALADLYASRAMGVPGPRGSMPVQGGHYESFSARKFRGQSTLVSENQDLPGSCAALQLERLQYDGAFGSKEWDGFLDACLRATSAETAFAMDGQGLLLASRGRMEGEQVGLVGTRLAATLDLARRMEISAGEAETSLIEFQHQWLTGIAVAAPDGEHFTVGVLAKEPVAPSVRTDIRGSLSMLLKNLTVASGAGRDTSLDF